MATIREFLSKSGFDFLVGRIIVQETNDLNEPVSAREISLNDSILDFEFSAGLGYMGCPRYVAEDSKALYFPSQYDGATSPEKIYKNINKYLNPKVESPYPGD
jgi:hypothetical protein